MSSSDPRRYLTHQNRSVALPPLAEAIPEIFQTSPTCEDASSYSLPRYTSQRRFEEASMPSSVLLPLRNRPSLSDRSSSNSQTGSRDSNTKNCSVNAHLRTPTKGRHDSSSFSTSSNQSPMSQSRQYLPSMSELQSSSYGDPVPYKHRDLPPISEDGYRRSGRGYDQGPDGYIAVERGPHSTYPSRGSSSNYGSTHIQNSIYPTSPPSETLYDSCGSSAADHHRYLEPVGDVSDQRNKRRKGNLPKQVTHILRNWFTEHVGHPYPTEEEKQMLMVQTGLTLNQISNWFINARRRSLPQLAKQARAEADLRENQNGSYKSARDTGMRRSRG